ncbi:hypothetical protein ABIA69_003916 [Lysinibacillus parviboronicapiens]|uniref:SMI1/KNR4 family protein n=1 Tax=Lysinibacillus parviboronicapiens TaxID=436516 RepID=A0ABV2PP29_9BACI
MKINELEKKIIEINVPKDMYSILKGGLPNEQYCITKAGDKWEVYYSERGNKGDFKIFDDEDTACEYFYEKVKKYAKIN